ncbi:ribonuclease H-like domain-containing protein [Tanacetum coccineum]
MCMCLKDHLDAKERKQDKCLLETLLDFEEGVFDDEVQQNEVIPLSDEEIALDASTFEFWNELKETFDRVDRSATFILHQKINSLSQNGAPIDDYFNKLSTLWKQFDALVKLPRCTCHAVEDFKKHNQLMKLMKFLMSLDDSNMQLRSNILSRELLLDAKGTYVIIFNEESYKAVVTDSGAGTSQRSFSYSLCKGTHEVTLPDNIPLRPNLGVLQIGIQCQGYREVDQCVIVVLESIFTSDPSILPNYLFKGFENKVFRVGHLAVSLGIIIVADRYLKQALVDAAIMFQSAPFGMYCRFTVLVAVDVTVPAAATAMDKLTSGDKSLDLFAFKLSRLFFSFLSSGSSSCWRLYWAQVLSSITKDNTKIIIGVLHSTWENIAFSSVLTIKAITRCYNRLGVRIDSDISDRFRLDSVCHSPHVFFRSPSVELCQSFNLFRVLSLKDFMLSILVDPTSIDQIP